MENRSMQTDFDNKRKSARIGKLIAQTITYIFLFFWAIFVIFPFYWMILTSLKPVKNYNEPGYALKFFINNPTFKNYLQAFTDVPMGLYILNTVIFALSTTAIMIVVVVLAAFAFSRLEFKGKNLVFTIFLAMMMIPNELIVITNYTTIVNLDWRNTYIGLILPSVLSVFYIYLLRQNFLQVPDSLYYAAKVDGTSDFKYLWKVLVPMNKPTIISILILKLIECWNSFVWPRLITTDSKYFLVSNAIEQIKSNGFGRENIPAMMAAVVVVSLPLLIIYMIFRKQIMSGVSKAGTKG